MPKITLTQLSTFDNTNVSSLNDSLQKIEDALNENVLYRDNITGEPNQAEQEYDMNSFRIINLAEPVNNSDAARLIDVQSGGGDTVTSFEGRTGDVTAESGDYTTDQVTEGSNLYYTSSRVQNDAPVTSVANKTGAVSINPSDIEQEGATDGQVMTWDNTAGQWEPQASGGAPVDSVFGRTGAVVAEVGDYDITDLGQTGASDGQTVRWSDFNNQWEPAAPGAAPVDSVFGRTGFVTAQSGDYTTDLVSEATNLYHTDARASAAAPVQDVAGKTGNVTISPSDLEQEGASDGDVILWSSFSLQWEPTALTTGVSSVYGRTGDVVAQSGDYNTDQVPEGANLYFTDARAQNAVDVPVDSVFGRTGDIIAQAGDYSATKITISDTDDNFSSSNVEGALKELAQSDFSSSFATPEEFGAAGDGTTDDTTPLQNAINTGLIVLLGPKTYRITSELNSVGESITIIGTSTQDTRILCDNCDGIDINQAARYASVWLKNFTMVTNSNGGFIGIDYNNSNANTGDKSWKVIENVHFFGEDRINFTPSFTNTWKVCLKITEGDRFSIRACLFQGAEEARPLNSLSGNPETRGIEANESTKVTISESDIFIFDEGVRITGLAEQVEVFWCNIVACGTGVHATNLTQPANGHSVSRCHISSYLYNVRIGSGTSDLTQMHNIFGNLCFKRPDDPVSGFRQVQVYGRNVSITDNLFHHGGTLDPEADNDKSVSILNGSHTFQVNNNIFRHQAVCVEMLGNNDRIGILNNAVNDTTTINDPFTAEAAGVTKYLGQNFGDRVSFT